MDQQAASNEHRKRIDQINIWVSEYLVDGNREARDLLLAQFRPFLIRQSKKWDRYFSGVHPMDHIMHEAQIIFCNLLDEFTIGGTAYFNVYIQRKLPFRLRYFFVKEIRRRTRDLSHSDEQLADLDGGRMPTVEDCSTSVAERLDRASDVSRIMRVIDNNQTLNPRERQILIRHLLGGQSHEAIALIYGISRSRVSTIIKNAIAKIRRVLNG